jgi:2-dehydropantoate 2-reductase
VRIVVIGAGAMGASYGGLLARSGHEVAMIDVWEAHVDAINRNGLKLHGVRGDHTIGLRAQSTPADLDPAEVAIIFVDSNHTDQAAETAAQALSPDGFAITFQNGIGNVETLQAVLGQERVLGGSSMCSAAVRAPGHVVLTHHGPTTLGETDGSERGRARRLAEALSASGLETKPDRDIMSTIWTKFALNCSINAICATAGLRLGEVVRLPALDDFQHRIIDEVLAVTKAKGIRLTDPDLRRTVKDHCFRKFSKPSMLQHLEAGKRTEIDALNGALVREAKPLDVPVPYNEALVALLKGRELHEWRRVNEPNLDYQAWEDQIAHGKGG